MDDEDEGVGACPLRLGVGEMGKREEKTPRPLLESRENGIDSKFRKSVSCEHENITSPLWEECSFLALVWIVI